MILQTSIPYDVDPAKPLPGVAPLDPAAWILTDDAYAAQIAERQRLLRDHRDAVLWCDPCANDAALELLETVLTALPNGFERNGDRVQTPDGRTVPANRDTPFETLAALVQEDLCILIKDGDEHVLRAALLCFPASWALAEKAGRPLAAIHDPVDSYDDGMARRVQRLFDGVQTGRPLWRHNALYYADAALFQPRLASQPRQPVAQNAARFLRSERQCILRLPISQAVVFSIHTYVIAAGSFGQDASPDDGMHDLV